MKIQKLIIHNLASIEDATIDFEAKPLSDSEVFLISGETGSGKSTILDAISLALYADTPRLAGTKMQGKMKEGDELTVDDPRQLLRKGAGEGYAKLFFKGTNGKHYEATWTVRRAHSKPTGNIQSKEWTLNNLDSGEKKTRDADINKEMEEAVGLGFDQFCRTTMLAQGEFTRFLNSKDNEKAEILEKITGVDIYSKIGAKIYKITGEKDKLYNEAKARAEGITTLSEEEIEEKNRELKEMEHCSKTLTDSYDKEADKKKWIENKVKIGKDIETAKANLEEAEKVTNTEDFKKEESLVNDWDATIDVRKKMTDKHNADSVIKQEEEELAKLKRTYQTLLAGFLYEKEEQESFTQQIERIQTFLSNEEVKSELYANSQTIVGQLNSISEGRLAIKQNERQIAGEIKSRQEFLQPSYDRTKESLEKKKKETDGLKNDIVVKEKELESLNLPKLRSEQQGIKDLLANIKIAERDIENLKVAEKKKEDTKKSLEDIYRDIDEKKVKSANLDSPIHDAEVEKEVCEKNLESQKDSVHKFAKALRAKLHSGDICPVCGQRVVSELPHEEELAELVSDLQKACDEAGKKYEDLVGKKRKLEAEINAKQVEYNRVKDLWEKDTTVSESEEKAIDSCKICGFDIIEESALKSLSSEKQKDLERLTPVIEEGERKEVDLKKLRESLESMRKDEERLREDFTKAGKAIDDSESKCKSLQAVIDAKENEIKALLEVLNPMLSSIKWGSDWAQTPDIFVAEFSKAAEDYNNKKSELTKLQSKQVISEENTRAVKSIIDSIVDLMPDWKELQADNSAKTVDLSHKANDLKANILAALSMLEKARETSIKANEAIETFVRENQEFDLDRLSLLNGVSAVEKQKKAERIKDAANAVVAKQSEYNLLKTQEKVHNQARPEIAENDTLELIGARLEELDDLIKDLEQKKGALKNELEADKKNKNLKGDLAKDIAEKKTAYEKWSRLNDLVGDQTGNKFRKIAQSYVLASLIHSANGYMKTLAKRYTLKIEPGSFIILLEDAQQGGSVRAASTISGGESFLVSLSLALALSDIGTNLAVSTLFIDEGFGTLSGEPLQMAINTLRDLHNKSNRQVGIISHIKELRERIPVKILVEQDGNFAASKIKVEPALLY